MIPLALKRLLPFYTRRWQRRYRVMLAEITALAGNVSYGQDGDVPWIEDRRSGLRFHGFWTEPKNAELYDLLRDALPPDLPKPYLRLVKDFITRFAYPHMRPDLKPAATDPEQMWGFHGQHKDAIADQSDGTARARLADAFRPKPDDIIIDGGSFLGMGDIRMARELPNGRIIAVEATRACYELLSRNLVHNGIANVIPLHAALWDRPGTLELDTGYAQANSLISDVSRGGITEPVETITVDDIVARFNLPRVTMLSLTLNGAEVEAIKGAQLTLGRFKPRIRLAGWYSRDGKPIWQITSQQLAHHGYDVFVGPRGNVMALPRA
jgi:FkbM family methyltransferase